MLGQPGAPRVCSLSAAVFATGLLTPTLASAQILRGVGFELQGRAQYDSNVAKVDKNVAQAGGLEPQDVRYSVTASVDAARPIGRQNAFLAGSVSYDFYAKNNTLDKWRADLGGGIGGRLGPCVGGLNAQYVRSSAELSTVAVTDVSRSVENVLSYGVNTSCPLIGNIGLTASAQQRKVRADNSRSQIGSDSTNVSLGLGYVSRTLGSLSVVGAYGVTDYLQPDRALLPIAMGGIENYSVGLQYSKPLGNRITGAANVNYFQIHRRDTNAIDEALTGGDNSGVSWGANFTYRASPQLSTTVGYNDSTTGTARTGSAYQHQRRINASANYNFGRGLSVGATASHVKRNFSGQVAGALRLASQEERTAYGVSLKYILGKFLAISLDGGYSETQTDQAALNYSAEHGSVTITAKF